MNTSLLQRYVSDTDYFYVFSVETDEGWEKANGASRFRRPLSFPKDWAGGEEEGRCE